MSLAVADPDIGVAGPRLHDALLAAVDAKTEFGDQGIEFTSKSVAMTLTRISVISTAIVNGEYDFDGTRADSTVQPILLRAEEVKAEIKDATGLKYKLEAKDQDIKDLKKLMKAKQEEFSEMNIRKDLLEKKLTDTNRDSDLMVEKLQRKLDDTNNLLKRKEKEFEETMDHLQADIESLEFERGELKDKMKQMSKKALIQGLSKSQMHNLSADGPQSLGPSVPSPVRDSPLLLQQVKDMRAAVNSLQTTQARIQGRDMRERLANLKPIKLPKKLVAENREKEDKGKESGGGELSDLMKRCNAARSDLFSLLSSQEVVDVSRNSGIRRTNIKDVHERELKESALRSEIERLRLETAKLLANKMEGGKVADVNNFGSFPSTSSGRALAEKEYSVVGRVRLGPDQQGAPPIPLVLNLEQLRKIHETVVV